MTPAWRPGDVVGIGDPVAPVINRPPGLVGEVGPGTVDLSLPRDETLFAAAPMDARRKFALIADARPDKLADVATKLGRAGSAMDVSAGHSAGALGQLGPAFTNDGRGVYDPEMHWGALPQGYRDAGSRLTDLARRTGQVGQTLQAAQTGSRQALIDLTDDLDGIRSKWVAEVDSHRGAGGLIPYDQIAALQARRNIVAADMQFSVNAAGWTVGGLVDGYDAELRGLQGVFGETGFVGGSPMAQVPVGPEVIKDPILDDPPWREIIPIPRDQGPRLEGGGFTPLFDGGPSILINVPAPQGPSITDRGLPPDLLQPGGVWYDRNSGAPESEATGEEPSAGTDDGAPDVVIDSTQLGHKVGKHAQDFGLDPSSSADRDKIREIVGDITQKPDEVRVGSWNPRGGGGSDYLFFRKGSDVVVTKSDGSFVTVLKGGEGNGWYQQAEPR